MCAGGGPLLCTYWAVWSQTAGLAPWREGSAPWLLLKSSVSISPTVRPRAREWSAPAVPSLFLSALSAFVMAGVGSQVWEGPLGLLGVAQPSGLPAFSMP